MKTTLKKQPTHRVYAVTKSQGQAYWRPIGAAWAHSDGEGLSVSLEYLPLNGAEIVIRTPLPPQDETEGGAP